MCAFTPHIGFCLAAKARRGRKKTRETVPSRWVGYLALGLSQSGRVEKFYLTQSINLFDIYF